MLSDQEFSDLDDSFWESVSGPEDLQNGELDMFDFTDFSLTSYI